MLYRTLLAPRGSACASFSLRESNVRDVRGSSIDNSYVPRD